MYRIIVSLILIALAAAVGWLAMLKVRSCRYRRLLSLAKSGDDSGFEACVSSNLSRMLISPFAKCKLQLELAKASGDRKRIRSVVNDLMRLEISNGQRFQVATSAFVSLAELRDKNGCKRLLEEMESISPQNAGEYRVYFDTVMCGKGGYQTVLEQRLSELEHTPARKTRGHVEYLLSCACRANGDEERSCLMRRRAAQDLDVNEERLEGSINVSACI